MAVGVSFSEFWNLTPNQLSIYYDAHFIKLEQLNYQLWLQGLYVYESILRASPIFNPFAKVGTTPLPYLDKPYQLGGKEEKASELTEEDEIKNLQLKTQLFFRNWARANKGRC